jgi:hypothetical protein
MLKLSLLMMAGLTVLIAIGLRWREDRMAMQRSPVPRTVGGGLAAGWIALQKRKLNRWVTAAALAALATMLLLGGLNWLRIWQGS